MEYLESLKFTKGYWLILLPFILMISDILTGYLQARKNNEVNSQKMRDGISKKIGEIVYIVVGICVSYAFNIKCLSSFVSIYIIYMEIVSILENCQKLGINVPEKITGILNNTNRKD